MLSLVCGSSTTVQLRCVTAAHLQTDVEAQGSSKAFNAAFEDFTRRVDVHVSYRVMDQNDQPSMRAHQFVTTLQKQLCAKDTARLHAAAFDGTVASCVWPVLQSAAPSGPSA